MSASAKVTALDIVAAAVRVDDGPGAIKLMLEAARHLPKLVKHGFEACAIEDVARDVLTAAQDPGWLEHHAAVDDFLLKDPHPASAAAAVALYSVAEASFWLGVVAGQKLAGGGR